MAKEDGHTRSNGHSVSASGSAKKDTQQRPETRKSPRKRKCLSSWEDTRDNSKKRSKKEESNNKATAPSSSYSGVQFHSEKSRDGLISARKLVEKSIKDLRNRRSNEFKRNAKDLSDSVIEKDFSGVSVENSESDQQSFNLTVAQCNEQLSKPSEVGATEVASIRKESEISMKGLIDNQKYVKKDQKMESLHRAVVADVKTTSKESERSSLKTKHRLPESSPSRRKKEKESGDKERHGRYSERKESDRKERRSQDKEENRRKERQSTQQQKKSGKETESSRNKCDRGDVVKDSRRKGESGIKDLRGKLSRNKRQGSNENDKDLSSDKEIKGDRDSKSAKKCRLDMSDSHKEKGFVTSGRKPLSAKPDLSQVKGKSVGSSSIEDVWSKVNTDSLKNSQENMADNAVNEPMSSSKVSEKDDMLRQGEWTEKKPLTPKVSHKTIENRNAMMISSVEEAMVRVNEEKISKYRGASNNEVKALTVESDEKDLVKTKEKCTEIGSPCKENQKEIHSNRILEINRCDKNPTSVFKCPHSAQNVSDDKDISSVFIEELISMDEHCTDIYNEKYDEHVMKDNVVSGRNGNKDAESCISSGPGAQDGSLSCFDVKLHVSEKEIKDLLGNEDSLSEGISIAKHDIEKKSKGSERRESYSRNTFKRSSTVDKKTEKKSSTRDKRSSVDKKRDNEPTSSKAVLKLPLGSKNVFSESVFENTKPVSVKENVYTSSKGTKIVLKSESLKAVKKTVPKNSLSKKEYDADREFLSQLKRKYAKEDLKNVPKHSGQKNERATTSVTEVKDKDPLVTECLNFELKSGDERKLAEECQGAAVCTVQSEISSISQLGETTSISKGEKQECEREIRKPKLTQYETSCYSKVEIEKTKMDEVSVKKDIQPIVEQRETSSEDHIEDRVRKCEDSATISSGNKKQESRESTSVIQTTAKISSPLSKQDSTMSGDVRQPLCEPMELEVVPSVQTTIQSTVESLDEKPSTASLKNGTKSCTESIESNISVLKTKEQSSLVSIDLIRSSILKKIEEKKTVRSESSMEDGIESKNDAIPESSVSVTRSQNDLKTEQPTDPVSQIKRNSLKKQAQEEKVQLVYNFKPPEVGLQKQNVCRDLLTETESITEFFDEESQLDLNGAVSLRARDGIDVRRQSFEKISETEEGEQGVKSSSMVEEMETEAVHVHESDVLTLQDSEAEEGEVHSSDTENNLDMEKFVFGTEKTERDQNVKDGTSRKRSGRSSGSRSKSCSKERERIEVDKPRRRNTSETDRSVRTPRRDSQRKYDSKEDRKQRDSRSKERPSTPSGSRGSREKSKERPSTSSGRRGSREKSKERLSTSSSGRSSRESRFDNKNSESKSSATTRPSAISRPSATTRHCRESRDSERYPRSHLSSAEVKSARLERFRDSENSRLRHNSSDAKSDRNSSYRSGLLDSETRSVHRESARSTREGHNPATRRK